MHSCRDISYSVLLSLFLKCHVARHQGDKVLFVSVGPSIHPAFVFCSISLSRNSYSNLNTRSGTIEAMPC